MCNNVILDLTGTRLPNRWVLTGAHLDSRNTGSGATATGIAPGADDNSRQFIHHIHTLSFLSLKILMHYLCSTSVVVRLCTLSWPALLL